MARTRVSWTGAMALVVAVLGGGCSGGNGGAEESQEAVQQTAVQGEPTRTLSAPQAITSAELVERLDGEDVPVILDVRSPEEYAEGHIPGAINIPHTDVAAQMSTIQTYKDKPVVVYCRSGYRAGKAADILIEADFSDVRHLEGDIMGWRDAGHELEQ